MLLKDVNLTVIQSSSIRQWAVIRYTQVWKWEPNYYLYCCLPLYLHFCTPKPRIQLLPKYCIRSNLYRSWVLLFCWSCVFLVVFTLCVFCSVYTYVILWYFCFCSCVAQESWRKVVLVHCVVLCNIVAVKLCQIIRSSQTDLLGWFHCSDTSVEQDRVW